jgi:photosystem II stability/assembly factor-like uncharacterized protein
LPLRHRFRVLAALAVLALSSLASAESFSPSLFSEMRWRCIGPFRGGRTVGAAGVPSKPGVFYIGVNNGGVWETNDYGRTWRPIFDGQPTQSIGALAVAPSDPNVIYVGSGEGLQRPDLSVGDGMYRSTDAGKTWKHLGLRDAQQISAIAVDPRDPKRLFVAVLGHPYGPNEERGVFLSTDGGETFAKSLTKDADTGAVAVTLSSNDPSTVYAVLWAQRQAPWENGVWHGSGSGLHKSTDGGKTWRHLEKGLPGIERGLGRIGIGVAPSDPKRLYALVEFTEERGALYASDDAGESWHDVNHASRVVGRGSDFAEVKVDPKNPDVVYVANTSTYKSTDGGKTFTAWKGAPGGDDYHTIWIDPQRPSVILLAVDQGATITVNGGETWSSWYNQPTAQLYHVSTDNRFPYWVYGGQQESGSVGIASRGDDGAITFRDWYPVGAEEYGYVAVDPLNPDLVYGGKLSRFSHSTKDVQDVSPSPIRGGKYRFLRTEPVLFSPTDPHVLYYAGNVLFKTTNGGVSWDVISPDLSREKPDVPDSVGASAKAKLGEDLTKGRRGVIYTVAPSPKDGSVIWAGTDDGLIHVTKDGAKTWTNVTPPSLTSWMKVSLIEASPFDAATAWAAINAIRLDDMKPHVLATHDSGKTWKEIVKGLPDAPVNAVREDPVRKGLLYAGTERGVFVSFDSGESWQSLLLNLPATSVRDLVVKNDDLVVGTHGRSFWILDDVTPLRQLGPEATAADAFLFAPQAAYRIKRSRNTDTPLPPEEPMGQNPPDGAVIDYVLKTAPKAPIALEILDGNGTVLRRFASDDKPAPDDSQDVPIPAYWIRPQRLLSAAPGMHRFVWDLHLPAPVAEREYPISAVPHDTPKEPRGPTVLPGVYTARLTVDGKVLTRPLTVKMDPRVKAGMPALEKRWAAATRLVADLKRAADGVKKAKDAGADSKNAERLLSGFSSLYQIVEGADEAPTTPILATLDELEKKLE